MKRLPIILLILVAAMSVMAGVSFLPHSHGGDFSHSQHQDCPFYQLSHFFIDHSGDVPLLLLCSVVVAGFLLSYRLNPSVFSFLRFEGRAPPVVL